MSAKREKIILNNKKAYFNYEILDTIEAGIVLQGCEVKSIRKGKAALVDSFARIIGTEIWLFNAYIAPYEEGSRENPKDPYMNRKLLLNRREIDKLIGKINTQNLQLIPTKLYFRGNRVKVQIGLGKSKKQHDKRRTIKEKSIKRDLDRAKKTF